MHHVFDRIMVQTNLLEEKEIRRDEWFVLGGSGFFLLFSGLLVAGMVMEGDAATTVKSASAVSEYLIFLVFIILNFYIVGMMTRVCCDAVRPRRKLHGKPYSSPRGYAVTSYPPTKARASSNVKVLSSSASIFSHSWFEPEGSPGP
jgi:hypothetical protein